MYISKYVDSLSLLYTNGNILHSFLHLLFFFVNFMAEPMAYGKFQARDQIQAAAVTMLDPLTHCARLGIKPESLQ